MVVFAFFNFFCIAIAFLFFYCLCCQTVPDLSEGWEGLEDEPEAGVDEAQEVDEAQDEDE